MIRQLSFPKGFSVELRNKRMNSLNQLVDRLWPVLQPLRRLSKSRWPTRLGPLVLIVLVFSVGPSMVWAQAHSSLKTIIVAVNTNTPPFVEEDQPGELTGYSIDLIQALATHAELQVTFEETTFDALLAGVATQFYDAAISCIFVSEERQKLVNFSDPYLSTGFVLVVRDSSPITTTADLTTDMNVGILQGGKDEELLRQLIPAKRIPILTVPDALDQAAAGVIDAAVVDEFGARSYIEAHPDAQLRILPEMLTSERCAIAVNKQETWLLSKLNQSFADLKDNQSFDKLYHKWFGNRPQTQTQYVPPTPTPIPATDGTPIISNELPADVMQKLAGVYYLTFMPSAPGTDQSATQYQVITLSPDGLWLANQAIQMSQTITTSYTVNQVQGVWHAIAPDQLSATAVTFQPAATTSTAVFLASGVVRLDYTMEVQADGQVSGSYAQYFYALGEDPTLAPTQPVEPIQFAGRRLEMAE